MVEINLKKAEREIQEIIRPLWIKSRSDAKISDISVGMQQRVEILKTLISWCRSSNI